MDATDDPYEIYSENREVKEKVIQLVKNFPKKGEHRVQPSPTPASPAYTRLNEIQIPALILVGEFDIPDVHAHAGAINAGIVNSKRIIVYKAGHLLPMEQPASFNGDVEKFMSINLAE